MHFFLSVISFCQSTITVPFMQTTKQSEMEEVASRLEEMVHGFDITNEISDIEDDFESSYDDLKQQCVKFLRHNELDADFVR